MLSNSWYSTVKFGLYRFEHERVRVQMDTTQLQLCFVKAFEMRMFHFLKTYISAHETYSAY